jgi:hypothetical protein
MDKERIIEQSASESVDEELINKYSKDSGKKDEDSESQTEKITPTKKEKWKKIINYLKKKINKYEAKISTAEEKHAQMHAQIQEINNIHEKEKLILQDAISTLKQQVRASAMLYEEQSNMIKISETTKKKPVLLPLSLVKKVDGLVNSIADISSKLDKNSVKTQNNASTCMHKSLENIKKEYVDYLIYIKSKYQTRKKKLLSSIKSVDKDIDEINNFIYAITVFDDNEDDSDDEEKTKFATENRKKVVKNIKTNIDKAKKNMLDKNEQPNNVGDATTQENTSLNSPPEENLNVTHEENNSPSNKNHSHFSDKFISLKAQTQTQSQRITSIADIQRYLERKDTIIL